METIHATDLRFRGHLHEACKAGVVNYDLSSEEIREFCTRL